MRGEKEYEERGGGGVFKTPVDCNFMHDKLKVSRLSNDISNFGCVGEHIERERASTIDKSHFD